MALQPDGTFIFNIRMVEMWGLPEHELATITRQTIRDAIASQVKDPAAFAALVERLDRQPRDQSTFTLALKDGRYITRSVAPQFIHGACVGSVVTYRDVTEAVRHGQEMAFNLQVLENSPPMYWVDRTSGAITYANPSACALLGYGLDEFKQLRLRDFSVRLTREKAREVYEATDRGESMSYPGVYRRKDGALRDVDVSVFRSELAGRSVFVVSVEDVTEQRLAQAEAVRQQALLMSLVDSIPDSIFFKDMEGRYQWCNKAYTVRSGLTVDAIKGRTSAELFPASRVAEIRARDDAVLSTLTAQTRQELITVAGGAQVFFETVISPLWDQDRKAQGLLAVSRDISDRKKHEAKLQAAMEAAEAATRSKSDFLANMSHEIRTPMNAIIGLSHLVLQTDLAPRQRDYVSKVQTAGQHLLGVINDILDFSKVEAGKLLLEETNFGLEKLLDTTTSLCAGECEKKGLELVVHVDSAVPPFLVGDSLRLGQVLLNLVNNAVKFTSSGHVTVSVRVAQRIGTAVVLEFEVRDSGIGMSQEQMARLFKSFSQADTSTTRQFGGTGLGLAISQRLAELMGGGVRVESEVGVGSIFTLTVKVGVGENRSRKLMPGPDLRGCRALVVDDSFHAREAIRHMLEKMTFVVTQAASGADAVDAVRSAANSGKPFRVVYLDWRMPAMDGIETAQRIKSLGLPLPPVLMMVSAHGREEMLREAQQIGLDGVLVKPVNASLLFDSTMDLLSPRTLAPTDGRLGLATALPPERLAALRGARILLVEDNDINQMVAREILESAGTLVDVAENGAIALEIVQERAYDLVFMDMHMPVMDGVTCTREIRKIERLVHLPILAMTANAMEQDRRRCLEAGMNAVVVKPIDPDTLWAQLLQWLPAARPGRSDRSADRAPASHGMAADGLPVVAGLDTAAGLSRVLNKKSLYLKILRKFSSAHAVTASQLREALAAGDLGGAERIAHTVKGVAGNIGADEIQALAEALETAVHEGCPALEAKQRVEALGVAIDRLLALLDPQLEALDKLSV